MAIAISGEVRQLIRSNPGAIVIQVQLASNQHAAAGALARARGDIAALDGGALSASGLKPGDRNGPRFVGSVTLAASGPLLYIDGGRTPPELLATIPDIVAQHLRCAGLESAVVASPGCGAPRSNLAETPRAAVLHVYPTSGATHGAGGVPSNWLDIAADWLEGGPVGPAWVAGKGVRSVPRNGIRRALQSGQRRGSAVVATGDLEARARAAHSCATAPATFALVGGGPGASDADLLAEHNELVDIARWLAPEVAYAFAWFDTSFRPVLELDQPLAASVPDAARRRTVRTLSHQRVFGGFPYQVLGPEHIQRLKTAGWSPDQRGIYPAVLSGGRLEVVVGSPTGWLVESLGDVAVRQPERGTTETSLQEDALRCLGACLPDEETTST